MTRTARRWTARTVVGALSCVALTACVHSQSAESSPAPQRSVIDTTTFAPSLEIDLSRFTRTRPGAYYRDVVHGDGAAAALNRTLTVKYVISLPSGTVVETVMRPVDVLLDDSVIRGWRDALPGMRAGGNRVVILPADLAYGRAGNGAIPPRATLVFEIDLIAVH